MAEAINIYKEYEAPSGDGGQYLKFEAGKAVKIRIASEPYIFRDVYKDKVTGKTRESVKYAWVVFDFGADQAKIMQLPVTGFKALQAIAADDDWGDPTKYNLTVIPQGAGKERVYQINPAPVKGELSAEQLEKVVQIELAKAIPNAIPLVEAHKGKALPAPVPREESPAGAGSDAVPTDAEVDGPINLDDIPF